MNAAVNDITGGVRPGVLSLSIKEKSALFAAYMPFIKGGGLFIPTNKQYKMGEEVFMLLTLMDDPAKLPVSGKVVWLTPSGAHGSRTQGVGVQFAFNDKEKARRWAEGMEKRGYAVSITEAGAEGALRVRLGNFVQRDDAERQLRNFKQEGLNGIIINLPQGFRPEARSSIP